MRSLSASSPRVTQVELSGLLGKPQSFVSKVERGERRPEVIEFCQVAEALGLKPAEILQEFLHLDLGWSS
ncbi:helix-turn-helix domain-containing protein [Brevundimonas sp.]|uniref:helix-turn-helix domain-containing protein n=1 Tax=Brevundimonas sp. TaxID=1871086 RepID=UPI003917DFFB